MIVNFAKHNPPERTVSHSARGDGKLRWIRWATDGHRDKDILDLPRDERWIWMTLCGLAGREVPHGTVTMTPAQLAREADLTEEQVRHALRHLVKRGRIEYATESVA